ncbi:MAG: hypothetical protein EU539_00470 [Promethearchaeota archaeon]|nr:MAG: hypothetical protein EU539_00470 [Candidatus Lokiarchaeota archaeon]
MQEARQVELRKALKEINLSLNQVNKQARNYIQDVLLIINKEIGVEKILSIILFGSQLNNNHGKNESTQISDCDLLIIFSDNVSNFFIRRVEKYFYSLENKHNFRYIHSNLFDRVIGVVQQSTGMFMSHFLTHKTYFEQGIFHKIFGVNRFLSGVFAPKKLVLSSVVDNSQVLWGEDLRDLVKTKVEISTFDMIRSTIMNLLISLFSILITPLKIFKAKYQLEAVKWALRASNFFAFEDSKPLSAIIKRFILFERSESNLRRAKNFYAKFLHLRKNPHVDLNFMLRCPFRIIKIHVKGILLKKLMRRKRRTSQHRLSS